MKIMSQREMREVKVKAFRISNTNQESDDRTMLVKRRGNSVEVCMDRIWEGSSLR